MTDARRRQEAEKERGVHKGLDRLGGLSRIKVGLAGRNADCSCKDASASMLRGERCTCCLALTSHVACATQLGEDKPFLEILPDVIRSYGMSMMYGVCDVWVGGRVGGRVGG